jgi:hypothetical protein
VLIETPHPEAGVQRGGAAELFVEGVVVAKSAGIAVEVDHDAAMQEPVEHGGDGGVAEDLAPGADAAVGGEHDQGLQVALPDRLGTAAPFS